MARPFARTNRLADGGLRRLAGSFFPTLCLILALVFSATAAARTAKQAPATQALTADMVQAKIDRLSNDSGVDAGVRDQAIGMYRSALEQLAAAGASNTAAANFQHATSAAPKAAAEQRAQTKALTREQAADADAAPKLPANLSLEELETRLTGVQAEAAALRNSVTELNATLQTMVGRPAAARQDLAAQKQRLDAMTTTGGGTDKGNEPAAVSDARRILQIARRLAVSAQVNQLEQELISLPARQDLRTAERDLASAKLTLLERRGVALQARIGQQRQREAERQQAQTQQVQQELAGQHPLLEAYAKQTASYGQRLSELSQQIEAAPRDQAATKNQIDGLDTAKQTAQQILDIGGGEGFGQLLRELRAKLPTTAKLLQNVADRKQAIIDARLQRLRLEEGLRTVADPEAQADALIKDWLAKTPDGPPIAPEAREVLIGLIQARKDILGRLADAYARHVDQLSEQNTVDAELVQKAGQLAARLDERMLWLPSTAPLGVAWLHEIAGDMQQLFSGTGWVGLLQALGRGLLRFPLLSLAAVAAFAGALALRRTLLRQLRAIETAVGRVATDTLLLTPLALLITLVLAFPWPFLLGYLGWLLTTDAIGPSFAVVLGRGLFNAAYVLAILRFFQVTCRNHGLFGVHFGWSDQGRRVLGHNLGWLAAVEAPMATIIGMTIASGDEAQRDGVGRLAFILGSLAFGIFCYRVLHPRTGAFSSMLSRDGLLWRSRGYLISFVAAVPAVLAGLAAYGYYHSAAVVESRLFVSGWSALLGLTLYSLAMRSIVVAHRRLALRRARERREQYAVDRATRDAADAAGEAVPRSLELPETDLAAMSLQTRTLLRVLVGVGLLISLMVIWSRVVPALGVLNDVVLWTHSVADDHGTQVANVTLWDLLISLLVVAATILAARNLPGSLEITILQRLSVDRGTRYAIAAISRYAIITVGLLIALDQIGADWSRMQWVVAALGVGLGFGLQEILANFVSGLIILFERPIRVGDTITVADLSGTVSRIQIRATTITDGDNREIIVPNKSFITDRVVNWTLSDAVTRLVLKVGIAYGSDTVLAHRVMTETAKANRSVLESPAPTVFFLGFGDSALNFEIRVFVRELLERMPVTHDLHMAIERALRENGIEIPFPQRDVHIRSNDVATLADTPPVAPKEKAAD